MLLSLKELVVLSFIGFVVFRLAKPVVLSFMSPEDFANRRNAWFILTVATFLSPSFWIYVVVAIPVLLIAGRKDSNPAALYLMLLHVVPPIEIPIPMVGISYLFNLSPALLLSFFIMTPAALRVVRSKDPAQPKKLRFIDYSILAYGLLTAVFYLRGEMPGGGLYPTSFTESIRREFVFFFLLYVPFFTMSRVNFTRKALIDTVATFCLACALLAAIGIFEGGRHWLLYGEVTGRWGVSLHESPYLIRGSSLRAMASTGHAMGLGYVLAVGFGAWLYVQTRVELKRYRIGVTALIWGGLFAAYTRGAWVGAVLAYFLFAALQPNPFSRLFKATLAAALAIAVISFTPLSDKITSVLPFLGGQVDNSNIVYRERLWDRTWGIVMESPLLGDQDAMMKMEDLRQGEGLIDLVNSYTQIMLDNGFIGLTVFMAGILAALFMALSYSRKFMLDDPDLALIGASLAACIMVMLVLIENGSFGGYTDKIFYSLAALATGYGYLGRAWQREPRARARSARKMLAR